MLLAVSMLASVLELPPLSDLHKILLAREQVLSRSEVRYRVTAVPKGQDQPEARWNGVFRIFKQHLYLSRSSSEWNSELSWDGQLQKTMYEDLRDPANSHFLESENLDTEMLAASTPMAFGGFILNAPASQFFAPPYATEYLAETRGHDGEVWHELLIYAAPVGQELVPYCKVALDEATLLIRTVKVYMAGEATPEAATEEVDGRPYSVLYSVETSGAIASGQVFLPASFTLHPGLPEAADRSVTTTITSFSTLDEFDPQLFEANPVDGIESYKDQGGVYRRGGSENTWRFVELARAMRQIGLAGTRLADLSGLFEASRAFDSEDAVAGAVFMYMAMSGLSPPPALLTDPPELNDLGQVQKYLGGQGHDLVPVEAEWSGIRGLSAPVLGVIPTDLGGPGELCLIVPKGDHVLVAHPSLGVRRVAEAQFSQLGETSLPLLTTPADARGSRGLSGMLPLAAAAALAMVGGAILSRRRNA